MSYCYPYKRGTGWRSQAFRSHPESPYNPAGGHTGFDQAMDPGTPIYAPGDGIIRNSGWLTDNYLANEWWLTAMGGDTLVIDCFGPDGTTASGPTFVIAHLQDSTAPVGNRVRKGEQIGISGNSGTATTGAHAHIEALPPNWDWNNGVYGRVDPEQYFTEYPDELGTITAQGAASGPQLTTTAPKEPFTMGQYEDLMEEVKGAKAAAESAQRGVWYGGESRGKKYDHGILPIVVENQRRETVNAAANAAALKNLTAALAKVAGGEKFDEAKLLASIRADVEAGVTAALKDGTVAVDITVAGGSTNG